MDSDGLVEWLLRGSLQLIIDVSQFEQQPES